MAVPHSLRLPLLLGVAVCLSGGRAAGQAQFRTGVDLVRLDIRVTDAAGRPITDLRADEVVVTERGADRPVLLFQRVTEPAETFVDEAARALTAEVASNQAFPRGHLYVLVFDQAHITAGNEQRARMAAEQFIRTRIRPADRVAIYSVPGPGARLSFTADHQRALAALEPIRGSYQRTMSTPFGTFPIHEAHRIVQGDDRLITTTIERLARDGSGDLLGLPTAGGGRGGGSLADDPSIARRVIVENARMVVNQSDAESRQFLQRLAELIRNLADVEGRKSVVLFSEGFFQDNLSRELEIVAAAAAQTYSVFYTIDLNQRGPAITEAYASETAQGSEIQARLAPLGTLAVETDGELFVDGAARSGTVLTRLAAQAQDYYLVGFEPSETARNNRGQYQRVSVSVTRPGAKVSTRTGYALRPALTPADRQRAVATVLNAPFVQQGLKLDYTTYLLKADVPGQQRVVLSLRAQLPVRSDPGDKADVVFVARDVRDGRVVASGADVIPLPEATAQGSSMGLGAWRVQFTVPAGHYLMRAVVREPGGLAGSADRRVEVRPFDTPDVAVSDLILGTSPASIPVRALAHIDDGLSGLLEAYARVADQLRSLSLTVTVRTTDGTQALASYTAPLPAPVSNLDGFMIRAPFTVPLAGVAPGSYVVHATLLSGNGVLADRTRFVDLVSGTAGPPPPRPLPPPAPLVAPRAIVEGQLGQALVAELLQRSAGTTFAAAAEDAARGAWERAEAAVQGSTGDSSFVAQSIRGLSRFVREDFPGAVAAWTRAQAAESDHALTSFFLGWAQERAGDTRAALTAWRGAAHLDPLMVSAHLALAEGYLKLQQPDLARQALRAGLESLPDSAELLAKLRQIEGREP